MNIGLHDTQSYSGFKKSYWLNSYKQKGYKLQGYKFTCIPVTRKLVTRNQKEKLQVTNQP